MKCNHTKFCGQSQLVTRTPLTPAFPESYKKKNWCPVLKCVAARKARQPISTKKTLGFHSLTLLRTHFYNASNLAATQPLLLYGVTY